MKKVRSLLAGLFLIAASLLPLANARAATNLVANPSFETANGASPAGWNKGNWGTNTTTFTYATTGHTGARSATVALANYTSGDAKWYFSPVTVTANTAYTFSDWYKSTVASEVDAVVTTTTGTTSYYWVGNAASSSTWKQTSYAFTTPANAASLTFFHVIFANGSLTTDDYSLTGPGSTPTAPTVAMTSPTANATVSGSAVNVAANASDAQGLSSVQFKLDGANLGAPVTSAPYATAWDSTKVANGTHTLSAVATNTANLTTTATNVTVNVNNVSPPTTPTISFVAPAADSTVNSLTTVTANASDATGITSVQFKLDGTNAALATTAPYTFAWDTTKTTNGIHTLTAVATNSANLTATTTESVTVNNPTAPSVNITSPANNATLSASQTITAHASDAVAVSSVQFQLDGTNLGSPLTSEPYSLNWDTTTASNGSHTLTAIATNGAHLSTTSAPVVVTVNNSPVTPPAATNLIPNPSVETNTNSLPSNWHDGSWGTNTHSATYQNTGHTGTHSLKTTITSYTNGDAKWYFDEVPVTPGTNYQYTNWYESNIDSEVDAQVTAADGTVSYYYVGTAPASPTAWTQVKAQFVAPATAKTITFYQVVSKVGWVQNDDFSLAPYTPAQFNRPLVTLTFDDGLRTHYTNALPLLDKYGMKATFYIISSTSQDPEYMTVAMMQALKNDGNEIADHTVTHPHLPTLTVAKIDAEMGNSQAQLRTWFGNDGVVGANFATPYGEYNGTVLTEAKKYFRSHRSTDDGFNSKGDFDFYNIRVQNILDGTTPAQVAAWVAQAQHDKTWLVLVYHGVEADPSAAQEDYSITPAHLDTELASMQQAGVTVETLNQALNEIQPQL